MLVFLLGLVILFNPVAAGVFVVYKYAFSFLVTGFTTLLVPFVNSLVAISIVSKKAGEIIFQFFRLFNYHFFIPFYVEYLSNSSKK